MSKQIGPNKFVIIRHKPK